MPEIPSHPPHLFVISIGTDRSIFDAGSAARERMREYGTLARELHIIIFAKQSLGIREGRHKIAENVWAYPTNSFSRWHSIFDAIQIGKKIGERFPEKKNILITTQDPFECGLAGWRIARAFAAPAQIQIHTDFLSRSFSRESLLNVVRVGIARFLLVQKKISVRVVSERIRESLLEKIYSNRKASSKLPTIAVLPIFLDVAKYRNTFVSVEKDADEKKILVVSRLEKEKGVDEALEIFASLPESTREKIKLLIAGEGRERKNLEKLTGVVGIKNHVRFLGWQSDLVPLYLSADLLLVPSRYEGYGRQIVEAAAAGCPILSYDVGIAAEMVEMGNGIVCGAGDTACMKNTLAQIFPPVLPSDEDENAKVLQNLTRSAHAFAEKIQAQAQSKEEYLARYRELWEGATN